MSGWPVARESARRFTAPSSHATASLTWTICVESARAAWRSLQQLRSDANARLHVACIMDGNGRWAGRRGLPRTAGHTEGEENLARLVRVAVQRDIGWLTVFGFSTENWVRPRAEVRHILGLHEKLFGRVDELNELNVRIQWIGRPFDSPRRGTPKYVQRAIRKAIADTAGNTGMVLTVAFDYGGRAELMCGRERAHARAAGGLIAAERSTRTCTCPSCRRSTCWCARAANGASPTSCCGRAPADDLLHRRAVARLRRRRARRRARALAR